MNYLDRRFADVDLILRRGGHINRSSLDTYGWLCDNYDDLRKFYSQYSATLEQHPDGFFFLTVSGAKMRSRLLPKKCVHLGLFIALKARDPEITRSSGWIAISQLLHDIETTVPKKLLQQIYAPNRKENVVDERIAAEINNALKILFDLHFVEIRNNMLKPLEAINRFAEFARHDNEPDKTAKLKMIVERGVVFHDATKNEEYEVDSDEPEDESQN